MGPKLGASKKQKTTIGTSSTHRPRDCPFNHNKFLEDEQDFRYRELASRSIWSKRTFNIDPEGRTYVTNALGCPTKFYKWDLNTTAQVDVARIIDNDIKMIASSGHHLGNITPSTLAFPGMIMGLCQKARVSLPFVVHETIDGEVNDRDPHVDHSFGTRDKFQDHANWSKDRPFQPKGAVGVKVETNGETVEESEEGESMSE
ncbi:hypothetical protein KIW84_032294 [Lathyrus oleraceus]|uniref:Uncharacterized protein n=1 Tax=Pisum sativum TaxID=3888 RepID=A0A9D4XX46_PEA|nr:hypothetical protein KIW84_032294 [Pisum sativum]